MMHVLCAAVCSKVENSKFTPSCGSYARCYAVN